MQTGQPITLNVNSKTVIPAFRGWEPPNPLDNPAVVSAAQKAHAAAYAALDSLGRAGGSVRDRAKSLVQGLSLYNSKTKALITGKSNLVTFVPSVNISSSPQPASDLMCFVDSKTGQLVGLGQSGSAACSASGNLVVVPTSQGRYISQIKLAYTYDGLFVGRLIFEVRANASAKPSSYACGSAGGKAVELLPTGDYVVTRLGVGCAPLPAVGGGRRRLQRALLLAGEGLSATRFSVDAASLAVFPVDPATGTHQVPSGFAEILAPENPVPITPSPTPGPPTPPSPTPGPPTPPSPTPGPSTPPSVTPSAALRSQSATIPLTISGTGFDATMPGNNTVIFSGGAVGTVTSATATSLTVSFSTLPTALGALNAIVTSFGLSSGPSVTVTTVKVVTAPNVTQSMALLNINASTLNITGTGFDPTPSGNTVVLSNGAVGVVTASTTTFLIVTFSTPPMIAGAMTAIVTSFSVSSGTAVTVATVVPDPTVTQSLKNLSINAPTLTITGTGFDPTPSSNTVVFSSLGAVGTVTSATATSLTVTFSTRPSSFGVLSAVVTNGGGSSGAAVQVANVTPFVTSTTATRALGATTLTIAGVGFDPTPSGNTVVFSSLGAVGTVTSATATSLTVTFSTRPSSLGALNATVMSFGFSSGPAVTVATVVPDPTVTQSLENVSINAPTLNITGTGFDPTPSSNTVVFSSLGAVGTVTSATATSLTVTFSTRPSSFGVLSAVVTNGGGSSGAAVQVANILVAPFVSSSTAMRALGATTLTIAGVGFDPTLSGNTVVFSSLGAVATVTSATATSLTVTFSTQPTSLGALNATVTSFTVPSLTDATVATVVPNPTVTPSSTRRRRTSFYIDGSGFDPNAAGNTVTNFCMDGTQTCGDAGLLTVRSATSTRLEVLNDLFNPTPIEQDYNVTVAAFGGSSGAPVFVGTAVRCITAVDFLDPACSTQVGK